jgi:hypothetical protein
LGGNFLGTPGDQGAGVGGVLGLLEDRQNISIQEYNVTQLRNVLERFRFLQQAQRINALQVTLVETRLYSAQQQLFRSTINYEASLDNFKINLGLPPEMKIVVEDPILEQFQLIDNNAVRLQDKLTRLREAISLPIEDLNNIIYSRALNADGQPVGERDEPVAFSWGDDVTERLEKLPDIVAEIETLRQSVLVGQLQAVRQDIERLRATRESRIKNLSKLKDLDLGFGLLDEPDNAVLAEELISEQAVTNPDKLLSDVDLVVSQLEGSPALELRTALENIRKLQQSHDNSPETQSLLVEGVLEVLPQALADVTSYSLELLLIQVKARVELVELAEVRLEPDVALRIAQHFRRDWMNARASLVDAWRLIEFQADQLESTFDLVFEGDVGTVGDNPTNFRTATGRARAGFRFDSPITRLQERNNYRTALIRYQQARRQYYQFRDGISRNLRQILRLIELNKVLFELNRLQIKVNAVNVEQSNFEVSRPAAPGARTTNPTIARDLTDAINQLQQAQSAFLSTWVDYEVLRRGLDFDLGTMKLDENSLWIDPGPINQQYIERLIEEDQRLLEELGGLDWFESREEFMESTGLDLKAMGGPGLPIPGEVETASGPSSGAAPEDEELNKLKQQLRSELQRLAKLESQRPATGATGATGAAAPATERAPLGQSRSTPGGSPPNFSVGGAMPQTPVRPVTTGGGGLPMPAMAVPPTEKTPSSTPPRSTPVDVTAAFPALPKPTGQLPSPQTLPPLTGLPALEDDRDPTATPRRFRPVVPQ